MSLDTLISKSLKSMGSGMNPIVKDAAIEVLKRAYKEGIYIKFTHGYRSYAEQAELYGKGRRDYVYNGKQYAKPNENKVTNAKPGYSNHNFGLAVDYVLCNEDGTKVYWTVNDKWRRVAQIAKSCGFFWGGDFKNLVDPPHLEMMGGLSVSQLRAGKRPNLQVKYTPIDSPVKAAAPKPEKEVKEVEKTPSPRFVPDVQWVKEMGISDGSNPTEYATREQVFNMLHSLYDTIMDSFPDPEGQASPSHKEALEWAKENGLSDGSKPQSYASRQQVVQMFHNYDKQAKKE